MMKLELKMKIRTKMLVYVLVTTISVLAVVGGFVAYRLNKMALNNAVAIAQGEAQKTANLVKADLELDLGFARALAQTLYAHGKYDTLRLDSIFSTMIKNQIVENPRYMTVWYTLEYTLIKKGYTKTYGRRSYTAFIKNGIPVIEVEQRNVNGDITTSNYYTSKLSNCEMVIDPYIFQLEGIDHLATTVSVPVRKNGTFQGLAGVDLELEKFQKIIAQTKPYKNTIVSLLSNNGTIIAHTNLDYVRKTIREVSPEEDVENHISDKIKHGLGTTYYTNASGEKRLNIYAPILVGQTTTPWSIGLSIPISSIMGDARSAMFSGLIVALLGIIVLGIVIWLIARSITQPIQNTTELLINLAQGDIDKTKKVFVNSGDEIEAMAKSLSKVIDGLNSTEYFAREIGKGNLNAKFDLLGEKDILGISLLEMQKSLKHAQEIEVERKKEEEKLNWTTKGIAMFGDILRQNNDNLAELTYNIVKNLVGYTASIQGGIFVLNDNDKENPVIEMTACYAYDRRKFLEKNVIIGEGLVGRCFIEGKSIFMVDIPKDYISITSGLGKENPRCLLLVPLKVNDEILGVIEMATFKVYEKYHIEFIEKVAASIASTISSVRINIRTAELLAKSQQQAEEMAAQEEEMRQNMEELQATQEEMERKRHEQDLIQNELREDKSLLDSLLHNSPDFIFQKDINGKYVHISDSMLSQFNASVPEEVIGLSDYDLMDRDRATRTLRDEQDVIRTKTPIINKVYFEKLSDGVEHKIASTILPLIDEKNEVIGILGITKVITDL
jgi:methyl-accepting chemotaxis protein